MTSKQTYGDEALLTIRQAAALIGVHPETLRRAEMAGHIKPTRTPGGHRRYSPAAVRHLQDASSDRSAS